MEGFFDQEKTKAFVYLLSDADDKNKALISNEELLVIRKHKKHVFSLETISHIKTENKKLLFPLIAGGIITPFAFLSYFINLFLPWIHLVAVLLGMLLFYLGWNGKSVLTIRFKNGDELHFFLPSISRNLLAFIDYANEILNENKDVAYKDLLFFEVDENSKTLLFDFKSNFSKSRIFPLFGYTYQQLLMKSKSLNSENIIAINPLESGREIKIAFDLNSYQMRPKLEGPILKDSVVDISKL